MALDGIGGVGAINVATTVKPQPKQQSKTTDIQISSAAQESAGSSSLSIDTIKPVAEKGNTDNKNGKDDKDKKDKWAEVQSDKEVSPDKVKEAVDDINKKIKQANPLHHTACSFKYHDDTNRISITVKNADTDEVIREIPPEKALDMLAKAWEMAGLLVDEKR